MILTAVLLAVETLRWTAIPPAARLIVAPSESAYREVLAEVERETSVRLRRGESEHFAYFVLQSRSFTSLPPIEPAVSAREFDERAGGLPPAVAARISDFVRLRRAPAGDARLAWFLRHAPPRPEEAYREAMRFLRDKEIGHEAEAYRRRGHSSDTRPDSTFAVWTAFGVLKRLVPALRIRRALIVGPGLEWAPRTAFDDRLPPQCYQPALVHDALLHWRLAERQQLVVISADVNPRVIEFLRQPQRPVVLPATLAGAGDREYGSFASEALASNVQRQLKSVRMNILTQRLGGQPFDAVVVTNVLTYFSRRDLALALSSIHSMLAPGGWLIHNETRSEVETISRAVGMPVVQARSLALSLPGSRGLFDAFLLHRKEP